LDRRRLLEACEMTMQRLATEPDFAHPSRYLFEHVRTCFPMAELDWVRRTIDLHIDLARQVLAETPELQPRECAAFSRQGRPCRRTPLEASNYCPSHRHLELLSEPEPALSDGA
jgi:hypothetical protein